MIDKNLRILAVVPARGGSKGIPRKNLQLVGDYSLVAHALRVAIEVKSIDAVILSTDDPEIASEAKPFGLEPPFLRPSELSGDEARSVDVWRHAWLQAEVLHGCIFDVSVLLEPTSPMRLSDDVERVIHALVKHKVDCCLTVSPTPAHYTPQKALLIKRDGTIDFYLHKSKVETIRQRIPPFFHRNGVCYAVRREHLIDRGQIVAPGSLPIVIERPVVNIDEPFDLELANWLYRRSHSR